MKRIVVFSLLLAAQSGFADIIPTLSTITPDGPNFDWDYTVNVTVDQNVQAGNYFTIYDFGPLLGSLTPAGWTMTEALTGQTPSLVVPVDSPSILNVTFTWTGGTISGPQTLGDFILTTTAELGIPGQFTGLGTRSGGPQSGSTIANIGNVTVPLGAGSLTTTPEPSMFLLLGMGLAALGVRRSRVNKP